MLASVSVEGGGGAIEGCNQSRSAAPRSIPIFLFRSALMPMMPPPPPHGSLAGGTVCIVCERLNAQHFISLSEQQKSPIPAKTNGTFVKLSLLFQEPFDIDTGTDNGEVFCFAASFGL